MIPLVAPLIAACAAIGTPSVTVPEAVVLGRPYDPQNAFAKLIRHEQHQAIVYEDRHLVAFMDYSPASPGHVLVISKTSRARNLLEMKDRDLTRLLHAARRIGRAEMAGLGADGFTIEQNNAYSQTVPHLHVHVIPRYLGYNRCIGSGLRMQPEVLEAFAARIRDGLKADAGAGAVPPRPKDELPAPAIAPATGQRALYIEAADKDHPAGMEAFQIDSHGAKMNAVLYRASGAGAHPTVLLLHGLPGNEQNLDLAQAIRRAGWNVLTLHYRGSWGSEGTFSFAHAAEDAVAALAFLRGPEAARYGVDPARIVIGGHSMGGTMAARAAAEDQGLLGTFLLDTGNMGAARAALADPAERARRREVLVGDTKPLAGTGPDALLAEMAALPPAFDLVATAPAIARRPLLLIGAERGNAQVLRQVADAAAPGGAKVDYVALPSDHGFSDRRLALTQSVVDWLTRLPQ